MARLYGRIVEATGWTYPQIDALEMCDAREMVAHWQDEPPLAVCARAFLGVPAAPDLDEGDFDFKPVEVTEQEFAAAAARLGVVASQTNRAMRAA